MSSNRKLYLQIYDYYKNLIEEGKLPEGEKLPSIRRCAEERNVSRTTVELAYMCLCDDGYVLPKNQSGYYVSKRGANLKNSEKQAQLKDEKNQILYDFSSSGVDSESFDMNIWRRYVKSALRQTEKLLFYGEPQGEKELRIEIAKYARETRNCVCTEDNIVIGAGVQTLLNILCPLLKSKKTISFEDMSYKQGITVFKDYGFKVFNEKQKSNILYVSPSYASRWGDTMDISERFALTEYARENNKLIIEDDYGNEFRYFNRPTPSLQGLDGGENVVYLGTFSKLLLPSIRISFMILPSTLLKEYKKKSTLYNQTVSKADQIALCSYIRDGHLNSQIRKARKLYIQKSKAFTELLVDNFGDKITMLKTHSPLYVKCEIKCKKTLEELSEKTREKGISFISVKNTKNGVEIAFSVSSVSINHLEKSVKLLKSTI